MVEFTFVGDELPISIGIPQDVLLKAVVDTTYCALRPPVLHRSSHLAPWMLWTLKRSCRQCPKVPAGVVSSLVENGWVEHLRFVDGCLLGMAIFYVRLPEGTGFVRKKNCWLKVIRMGYW